MCKSNKYFNQISTENSNNLNDLVDGYDVVDKYFIFTPLSVTRGIHTSCIKHRVRIENHEILSLKELLMYRIHCLPMLISCHCPSSSNRLAKLTFCSSWSVTLYHNAVYDSDHSVYVLYVCLCLDYILILGFRQLLLISATPVALLHCLVWHVTAAMAHVLHKKNKWLIHWLWSLVQYPIGL